MASGDGIADALRRLADALHQELDRQPQIPTDLLRKEGLQIPWTLEVGNGGFEPIAQATELRKALRLQVDALIAHHKAFRPGHVLSLRTGKAEGKETRPPDSRFVFGGYGPSGHPRFLDFGQWLLQLEHPDQHILYRKPPGLVTVVTTGEQLTSELLPIYRQAPVDQKIHGQVTAGWYPIRRADGTPATLAITLQVISSAQDAAANGDDIAIDQTTRPANSRRRIGLNLLVAGPEGEDAEEVYARLDPVPWTPAVAWARQALASVEASQHRKGSKKESGKGRSADIQQRIQGVLGGLARRLAQKHRGRERRTGHAEKRHQSGRRPTRMAMQDLERAEDHDIFVDSRRDTLIVLGERGRTHVFSRSGKLVTSIRYPNDAIEKKQKAEIWLPAGPGDIRSLRQEAKFQGMTDGEPTES